MATSDATQHSICSKDQSDTVNSGSKAANEVTAPGSTFKGGLRSFLSKDMLIRCGDDKMKRKLSPIQKWASLEQGFPYLAKRVVSMEVKSKTGGKEIGYYGELETADNPLVNVWLTDLMVEESRNYDLRSGMVYLVPLGKAISMETGHEYNNFMYLKEDDLALN